jgi:outer membrane protein assembly factor BamE
MVPRHFVLAACLGLGGCFLVPHKMPIQQGNYVDAAAVARLKPGMSRSQVRFLLGTPLVVDAFHPDRWDYVYLDRQQGKLVAERRLTLWFEGDKLTRAITDLPAAPAQGERSAMQSK